MKSIILKKIVTVFSILFFLYSIQSCNTDDDLFEEPSTSINAEIISSSHVNPKYYFGEEDCLNQGAEVLLEMGTKVIKVWYYNGYEVPENFYPWNSDWPTGVTSLVEGLNDSYYTELFDKPFKTFILNIASFVSNNTYYWRASITQAQIDQEESEFYEFTKLLLNKYEGTGKIFVLQHHEGDWHTRTTTDANIDPLPGVHERMIEWLNARQRGVARAREEFAASDVSVYHAAEVNLVVKSMIEGKPNMVNEVLPFTNLDLVSYSCYDACLQPTTSLLEDAVQFIKDNMPDSEAFGNDNVYIGEYGVPENYYTPLQIEAVMTNTVEVGLEANCPYIIYWQLYDNELVDKDSPLPISSNSAAKGFWLIKPDGTKSWHYDYLREMINK